MRTLLLSSLVLTSVLMVDVISAQTSTTVSSDQAPSEMRLMHEDMARIHNEALVCLKSGRAEEECTAEFREKCLKSGMGSKEGCGGRSKKMKRKSG
jgi:hypothetical protein